MSIAAEPSPPARFRAHVADRELKTLTASGARIERGKGAEVRRLVQPWQASAMKYHDLCPPIRTASRFYERPFSEVRLFVGRLDESGEIEEVDNDPQAQELLSRIQDPGGGTSGWKGAYGRLKFMIGDGYLAGTGQDSDDFPEEWEYLSPWELRPLGDDRYQRIRAPGLTPEELIALPDDEIERLSVGEVVAYRLWTPHPLHSWLPDSPMISILDLCEEYVRLTMALRTQVVSRAAGPGFLYVPEEASQAPPTAEGTENALSDPWREDLAEGMMAPLENPGTAADFVPVVIFGPATLGGIPAKDAIFHLTLRGQDERKELAELREQTVRQIAVAIDQPPEWLLGTGDSNHWSAWVSQEIAAAVIRPAFARFCADLTGAYYRPACAEAGVNGWQDLIIGFDDAHLFISSDRASDVREAYRDGVSSAETYRDAIGLSDEDEPTEDEQRLRLAITFADVSLLPEDMRPDQSAAPENAGEVIPAPPEEPPQEPPAPPLAASAYVSIEERIIGAAELAVERCRERAGSMLRNRAKDSCSDCYEKLRMVTQPQVAASLGTEQVRELTERSDRELVAGGAEGFMATVGRWGVSEDQAARLGELIERHAAKTLFDSEAPPLPVQFVGLLRRFDGEGERG